MMTFAFNLYVLATGNRGFVGYLWPIPIMNVFVRKKQDSSTDYLNTRSLLIYGLWQHF